MSHEERLAGMFGSDWRQYPSHPNYYFSRDGRCARVPLHAAPRILIGCESGSMPYRAISLCDGSGAVKREYLHRAVCEVFNGPSNGMAHCRHLDGDVANCAAENLAWGTPTENMADMKRHGRTAKGKRNPMAKLSPEKVADMRQIRLNTGAQYHAIAKQFGVSTMTAFRAITGEAWA